MGIALTTFPFMKTIIAGSRTITDYRILLEALTECGWEVSEVVSGAARGADRLGEQFAKEFGLPLHLYPADWDRYGKRAGYMRNQQMAENAEALIALWDGVSKGTVDMINRAVDADLQVYIKKV